MPLVKKVAIVVAAWAVAVVVYLEFFVKSQ
jgi:hypothetical protein